MRLYLTDGFNPLESSKSINQDPKKPGTIRWQASSTSLIPIRHESHWTSDDLEPTKLDNSLKYVTRPPCDHVAYINHIPIQS